MSSYPGDKFPLSLLKGKYAHESLILVSFVSNLTTPYTRLNETYTALYFVNPVETYMELDFHHDSSTKTRINSTLKDNFCSSQFSIYPVLENRGREALHETLRYGYVVKLNG